MADPRAEALLRALSGGGGPMPEEGMEPEMAQEGYAPGGTMEEAITTCLSALEPFMEDPRIAQAASALQEVVAGPAEMPADSLPEEAAEPMPQ